MDTYFKHHFNQCSTLRLYGGARNSVDCALSCRTGRYCQYEPCVYDRGDVVYDADCGTLLVQENRADPISRLISVPVTIVRSMSSKPAEPIFFLPGGPGNSNQVFTRKLVHQ